jgi:hypothetical protein
MMSAKLDNIQMTYQKNEDNMVNYLQGRRWDYSVGVER